MKGTSLLKYFGLTLNYFIIQYIVYVKDMNILWWTGICVAAATVLVSMTWKYMCHECVLDVSRNVACCRWQPRFICTINCFCFE